MIRSGIYAFIYVYTLIWLLAHFGIQVEKVNFPWPLGKIEGSSICSLIGLVYLLAFPFIIRKMCRSEQPRTVSNT